MSCPHLSPFCNKVRRCLRYKELAFSVRDYNGLSALKAAKLSRQGTLPVLEYDGEYVVDSAAIAAFLDDKYPGHPLYPADPEARAMARFWEDWAGQSLYFYELYFRMLIPDARAKAVALVCEGRPAWEKTIINLAFKRRYPKKLAAQGLGRFSDAEIEQQILTHLDGLERILERRPFLVGDSLCIADISVAGQLDELVRTSRLAPQILASPKVADWLSRLP